jgi:hypothetical protein
MPWRFPVRRGYELCTIRMVALRPNT